MNTHSAPFYHDVADGPDNGAAHWLTTTDGVRIRMSHWRAEEEKGTVLLFPGRTEYVEKYGRTARAFGERGYAMLAIDWRGQGLADRLLDDRSTGHVHNFDDYQTDIAAVLAAAESLELPKPYFLLGHSMGGAIGLRALMSDLPVNAAVFSAPMWGILLAPAMRPFAWGLSWTSKHAGFGHVLAPGTKAETYVLAEPFEGNSLTNDVDMYGYMQEQMRSYPDLALGGPSLHWLHEALLDTCDMASKPAPEIPCLTFLGDQEQIVDTDAVHKRMKSWPNGKLVMVKGGQHEVLMEQSETRESIHDQAADFFDKHL